MVNREGKPMETAAGQGEATSWSDFSRRTLRAWAVFEALYAVSFLLVIALFLPWKTPIWNLGLMGYGALHAGAAIGLWGPRRWGWRLATIGAFVGFTLAILVISGLVASWMYLHSIYGAFGAGASLGALLFASVGVEVLGLYPTLLLRAMLRREVRQDVGAGKSWGRVALGLCVLPFITAAYVDARYDMEVLEPVSQEARQVSIAYLRASLDGRELPSLEALSGVPVGLGPLQVTLWRRGAVMVRVLGDGRDMAESTQLAAAALLSAPALHGVEPGDRLKVDRVVGRAPIFSEQPMFLALSVDPGRDGVEQGGTSLLPDDLVKAQLFGVKPLVPQVDELKFGLNAEGALALLNSKGPVERIRTESWVEYAGQALAVERTNTLERGTGPEVWREAAVSGGDFVLGQLMADGRFYYQYFPHNGQKRAVDAANYSLPRHAGTVYALALLYGHTKEPRFKKGAEQAINWLASQIPATCGAPSRGCVVQQGSASLGAAALTMVGMLEYQRSTGDAQYEPIIRRLGEFILMLQKEDGDFFHTYVPTQDRIEEQDREMFYSEEASLALITGYKVLGEARYRDAAERALDFLTGPKYESFFLGNFVFGADHWTCIAAAEAYPVLDKAVYLDFCKGYSSFIRGLQYESTSWPAGFAGHYGFGAFLVPQAPATAGFSEAIISTYELSVLRGEEDEALAEQVRAGLDALSRDQIRPQNAWMMPQPAEATGGIRRSLVEQEVRIDFTQHAASALIRGSTLKL